MVFSWGAERLQEGYREGMKWYRKSTGGLQRGRSRGTAGAQIGYRKDTEGVQEQIVAVAKEVDLEVEEKMEFLRRS